jgi:TonB-dependent starch-binding outer membrane protein SusC
MKRNLNYHGMKYPDGKFQKLLQTIKIAALLLFCGMANALAVHADSGNMLTNQVQQQKVTGRVTDQANGEPLTGVNVVIQGSNIGTNTDIEGYYSLDLKGTDVTLDFTFIGYTKQSIKVQAQKTINVQLVADLKFLDEVVVVGYGKSSKKDITGSVSTVSEKEMNKGVYSSPAQMLQGKVPGLNITRSGDPTARPSITLRGPSTLRTGEAMEPFYVIDGVPGASIEAVAADDIVSIDILRDASSTAIYGSRAANGVIMVSTRRAKSGQSYVNYSGYMAVENISNSIDMLSAAELRDYLSAVNKVPFSDDGSSTNWENEVTRTGISHNHNLSFGGGSEKTTYGASLNYLNNEGIIKTSSLDRWTARINVEQKAFNNKVTVGLNLTNAITNKHVVRPEIFANMLKYLPTVGIFNADGSYFENTQNSNYYNPVALLNNDIDDQKVINQLANATLKINILPGLTYDANISLQNSEIQRNQYSKQASTMHLGANGYAIRSEYTDKRTLAENYLTFEKVFAKHSLKVLAGYSWQEDKLNDGFQAANSNFISDDLLYNNLSLGSSPEKVNNIDRFGNATIQTLRIISFYSRLNYQFNNKYLLQATLRRDGSSAFGTNNHWGTFPSASLGWRIVNESFMENLKFISDLKLRFGYGISGNSLGFDPMISRLKYGVTGVTYINGVQLQAVGVTQNENPDLKWESTAMTNLGLDFGFMENRITGTIELYNKQTSDLIWYYPVSTTKYLYPNLWANVGKVSNKGVEFQINITPVKTTDFQWTTSFNISRNVNRVISLSNDQFPTFTRIETASIGGKGQSGNPNQVIKEGEPIGTFFLRQYAGRNSKGVSMFYLANGDTSKVVTVADFVECGSAQPKFMFGWNNTFTYKNFDLSFFLRGVSGNKILNGTLASLNDVNNASNNNIPKFSLNEPATDVNSFYYSDRYLEDGSYLRLDNASLGYTLNLNSPGIRSARIYITTNNLFVLTKYKGIDPEINLGGIEPGIDNNNFYPKTRSFMMGVNVNF